MFYGVYKIEIDLESLTSYDGKILASVSEKIRKRFKASCVGRIENNSMGVFYVSFFSDYENEIVKKFDHVSELIEEAGVGRICSESSVIESTDTLYMFEEK